MKVGHWFLRLRLAAWACVAAALLAAPTASAALLAYEPFDYQPGSTVTNGGGGFGFADTWQVNSTNVNNFIAVAGSHSYTDSGGRVLVTSGNRAWATGNATNTGDDLGGNTGNAQSFRALSTPLGYLQPNDASTTTWLSYLVESVNTVLTPYTGTGAEGGTINYGRAAALQLFNTNAEQIAFGRASQNSEPDGYANDTLAVFNRGAAPQTVASNAAMNELHFVLVRIDHNPGFPPAGSGGIAGGNDVAYMWVNPDLDVEPSTGTALMIDPQMFSGPPVNAGNNDRDYQFNRIRVFAGSNNATVGYGSIQIDEIRIGTTFESVTPFVPEPSAGALAALAVVGLLRRRR